MVLMTVSIANVSSYLSTLDHCLKWLSHLLLACIEYFEFESTWIELNQIKGQEDSPLCPVVGIRLPASSLQRAVLPWSLNAFLFYSASAYTLNPSLSSDWTVPFPKCDFWMPMLSDLYRASSLGFRDSDWPLCPLNCVCAVTPANPAWYTIKHAFL